LNTPIAFHHPQSGFINTNANGQHQPIIKRELYQQAEQILVEDTGGIFLFWARTAQFWRSYFKGNSLAPNKNGTTAFSETKLALTHYTNYVTSDRASG
jgi:hypothetical protein